MEELRRKLPYRYASIISKRLTGITPTQVRLAFYGQITDPSIVIPVLEKANELFIDMQKIASLKESSQSLASALD